MLSKKHKLTKKDFINKQKGESYITPFFRVSRINKEAQEKFAVIISKKYIKKANKRNAFKRKLCYAYTYLLKDEVFNFNIKNKIFILILIKKEEEILKLSFEELKNILKNTLSYKK